MNGYLVLHMFGVVLFLGNIITAAFWKIRADVKGDLDVINSTVKNVMLADWVFTLPGLLLIIISGNLMAFSYGYEMHGLNWLTASLILFALTGVIWVALLIPCQVKMIKLSNESIQTGKLPKGYRVASLYWGLFGTLATLTPIGILYLMLMKPF